MRAPEADRWLLARMSDDLLIRLDAVRRPFAKVLLIGGDRALLRQLCARGLAVVTADPAFAPGGVQCDEDRLPFADRSFDLIVALGTLDTVNDVPGALILIRRILAPGGLFMGAVLGAGSLPALRRAVVSADGAARFHPLIDVRAAGDLLGRAGFALPVVDADAVEARYAKLTRLTDDLRANGLRNVLAQRTPLSRSSLVLTDAAFARARQDGKTSERFTILYLTGWAPEEAVREYR